MHGRNTFSKKFNKVQRTARRPRIIVQQVAETSSQEISASVDIGNWRITEDEDGSLILYNFETGNKVIMATKE